MITALTVGESTACKCEAIPGHGARPQDHRQVLVIHDVLPEGANDLAGLLVQPLAVPVGVDLVKLGLDVVVNSHEHHMKTDERSVLVHT